MESALYSEGNGPREGLEKLETLAGKVVVQRWCQNISRPVCPEENRTLNSRGEAVSRSLWDQGALLGAGHSSLLQLCVYVSGGERVLMGSQRESVSVRLCIIQLDPAG